MYGWLWRSLPGRPGARAAWMLLLVLIAVAALWFGVFPWLQLHVPVDGTLVPVEVTGSVLVDPEGARRDG